MLALFATTLVYYLTYELGSMVEWLQVIIPKLTLRIGWWGRDDIVYSICIYTNID